MLNSFHFGFGWYLKNYKISYFVHLKIIFSWLVVKIMIFFFSLRYFRFCQQIMTDFVSNYLKSQVILKIHFSSHYHLMKLGNLVLSKETKCSTLNLCNFLTIFIGLWFFSNIGQQAVKCVFKLLCFLQICSYRPLTLKRFEILMHFHIHQFWICIPC